MHCNQTVANNCPLLMIPRLSAGNLRSRTFQSLCMGCNVCKA